MNISFAIASLVAVVAAVGFTFRTSHDTISPTRRASSARRGGGVVALRVVRLVV